jgi:integrase
MAPTLNGQFDHEQTSHLMGRYQASRAPVKLVSRQVPGIVNKGHPTPGPVVEKTNWPLLEARVRETLRVAHYSYRTEQTYLGGIRQFVTFHQGRKPSTMDASHVRDFLRHLAMERQVASSTQNQALNAVVFLFKSVLKKDIGDFSDFQRARRGFRLPVVASREEIKAVIGQLSGRERFMGALLYGTGMRINELLRLRVQDVQFDQNQLMVRGGKGDKDRYVPFPKKYREEMQHWLKRGQDLYDADKANNQHEVEVPGALAQKYPNAPWEWRWQYVFPQVETTMIYTHVLNKGPMGVISPVDTL